MHLVRASLGILTVAIAVASPGCGAGGEDLSKHTTPPGQSPTELTSKHSKENPAKATAAGPAGPYKVGRQ